jgi:hypothetical protein
MVVKIFTIYKNRRVVYKSGLFLTEIRGKRGQFWLRQRKMFTKRWGKRGLGDEFMRYFLAYFWRIKAQLSVFKRNLGAI